MTIVSTSNLAQFVAINFFIELIKTTMIFYGEGNIFKYEDDKMIFVGSSKFNGENSEVHYTEEFREPIYEKLLKELKKEYQNERRRFRARYKGLEEDEFFKESLDEIKRILKPRLEH